MNRKHGVIFKGNVNLNQKLIDLNLLSASRLLSVIFISDYLYFIQ